MLGLEQAYGGGASAAVVQQPGYGVPQQQVNVPRIKGIGPLHVPASFFKFKPSDLGISISLLLDYLPLIDSP